MGTYTRVGRTVAIGERIRQGLRDEKQKKKKSIGLSSGVYELHCRHGRTKKKKKIL